MKKPAVIIATAIFIGINILILLLNNSSRFCISAYQKKYLIDDGYYYFRNENDLSGRDTENRSGLYTDTEQIDPYTAGIGMTYDEFNSKFGDDYGLLISQKVYSADVPKDRITEIVPAEYYQSRQTYGRTVLVAHISKGKCPYPVEHDMKNLVDADEYFSHEENEYNSEDEFVISHNEVMMSDGTVCTIDITGDNGFDGEMNIGIFGDFYGGFKTWCAKIPTVNDPMRYKYDGHFSLIFDDYNNDLDPDFTFRVCTREGKGGYYKILYTRLGILYTRLGENVHNYFYPKGYPGKEPAVKDAFYIYGTNDDSIRLDHLDNEHCFFMTQDDSGKIIPVIFDKNFIFCDAEDHLVRNRLFSSFYYNGTLYIKATNSKENMNTFDGTANITIRHLDGSIWRKVSQTEKLTFSERTKEQISRERDIDGFIHGFLENDHFISIARKNIELQKGLYSIEIEVPGDEIFYLDFYVR